MTEKELQSIDLLSQIEFNILKEHILNHSIYSSRYSKGATVHNQEDLCNTLDLVLEGSLIAYSLAENGSASVMFEFKKGDMIGANLLFGKSHTYPLNIYCLDNCKLLHITAEAVLEYLHNYHFVLQYVKSLSLNSQGMNKRITMFTQKTLRDKLLKYLKQQSIIQNSTTIILPISKRELADYLGVQRPSLFRELKKLNDEQIIESKNRTIKILEEVCNEGSINQWTKS